MHVFPGLVGIQRELVGALPTTYPGVAFDEREQLGHVLLVEIFVSFEGFIALGGQLVPIPALAGQLGFFEIVTPLMVWLGAEELERRLGGRGWIQLDQAGV